MGTPVTLLFQKDGFQDARLEVYLEGDGQPGGGISIFDEYVEKKREEATSACCVLLCAFVCMCTCFCVRVYMCCVLCCAACCDERYRKLIHDV
jgi:hypothetical protein